MTATTSLEAYEEIKASGALTSMRLKALHGVYVLGECTGAELDKWGMTEHSFGHLHKRLLELHRCRVVVRSGSRNCRITGKRATTWRATGTPPVFVDVAARKTRGELEAEIVTLSDRVDELENELTRYRQAPRGQQSLFGVVDNAEPRR